MDVDYEFLKFLGAIVGAGAPLLSGLYFFIHKDFNLVRKEIEVMKEDQRDFRKELKEIRERNDKIIIEQNARLDGMHHRLDNLFGILLKKLG